MLDTNLAAHSVSTNLFFDMNISMILEFAKEFFYIIWPHFFLVEPERNKQMLLDLHQHQKTSPKDRHLKNLQLHGPNPISSLRVDKIQEVFTSTKDWRWSFCCICFWSPRFFLTAWHSFGFYETWRPEFQAVWFGVVHKFCTSFYPSNNHHGNCNVTKMIIGSNNFTLSTRWAPYQL